ncbi:hypothetical protein SBRCBS47491_009905 [Sporothrix bragantina]|uniref:MARVEL domain-containing protein n=1 Tax=Sporothrix bragantina TaxID=671064 RepID=A0ABP0D162_9PEZI
MAIRTGIGLKVIQFTLRSVIFLCALVILIIFAYFLGKLNSADLYIPTWARAVEGLSGSAALYSLLGMLLLWWLAGRMLTFIAAIILDICFIGSFIYIATANRGGSGNCNSDNIRSPFGTGDANTDRIINRNGDLVNIPSFRVSCRLQKACLAVAIIAIGFLLFTMVVEFLLWRNYRKEKKFGPGPNNDYTSGSGRRRGLFGKKRNNAGMNGDAYQDPNALPQHAEPNQMRESYATEATAVGTHGAIDPNKPVENNQRVYGNMPEPINGANTNAYAHNNLQDTSTFRGAAADPNFHEADVDPNLQSSINPSYRSATPLAEGPEVPTVRGTGVDNYENIRAAAAEKSYLATHPGATTGATAMSGAAVGASGVGSGIMNSGADPSTGATTTMHGAGVDEYANVRGNAVDPNVWGGVINPETGEAAGLRGSHEINELPADTTTSGYGKSTQF